MFDVSTDSCASASLPVGPLLQDVVREIESALGPGIALVLRDSRATSWVQGSEQHLRRALAATLLAAAHAIRGRGRVTIVADRDPVGGVSIAVFAMGTASDTAAAQPVGCPAGAYEDAGLVITDWRYEPGRFSIALHAQTMEA